MLLSVDYIAASVGIGAGLWFAGALFIRATHTFLFPDVKAGSEVVTTPAQGLIFSVLPPVSLVTMQGIKVALGLPPPNFVCASVIMAVTVLFMDAIAVSYTSVYIVPRSRLFLTAGSLLWAVASFLLAAYLIA